MRRRATWAGRSSCSATLPTWSPSTDCRWPAGDWSASAASSWPAGTATRPCANWTSRARCSEWHDRAAQTRHDRAVQAGQHGPPSKTWTAATPPLLQGHANGYVRGWRGSEFMTEGGLGRGPLHGVAGAVPRAGIVRVQVLAKRSLTVRPAWPRAPTLRHLHHSWPGPVTPLPDGARPNCRRCGDHDLRRPRHPRPVRVRADRGPGRSRGLDSPRPPPYV